jgi:CubicO group peptidase (beta-lactamase class C family)
MSESNDEPSCEPTLLSDRLDQAIRFATEHEIGWVRDPVADPTGVWGVHQSDPPPYNRLFGPVQARGGVSGVIFQDGQLVREFGEPDRADLTFSVAKAYLALLAGVAHDQGLLPDVHRPIVLQLPGIGFDQGNNRQVTWAHLLQQTSEWTGTCFDIPDQVDHYRSLAFAPAPSGTKGERRPLEAPGTFWEYNDVRINQLSLALLHLFGRPLPEVFAKHIAQPCGLSETWRWVGYDHAWVTMAGQRLPSVPGGSHWGAGVSISAHDQARIGQMMLDQGQANGQQVVSAQWIAQMQTPCPLAPFYGYLVWLNHERRIFKSLPPEGYFGMGAGGHFTLVEPTSQLVAVVRWLKPDQADTFFGRIYDALKR